MPFATAFSETLASTCRLALLLEDAFLRAPRLVGAITVRIDGQAAPWPKPADATWVFFALANGAYTIHVDSDPLQPYYEHVDIDITLPAADPRWPAYPDRSLANPALRLDDPAQPAAYRAQRALAALRPTTAYPFPTDATLVRGTVTAGAVPLAGATVSVDGGPQLPYQTAGAGSFVIFFDPPGAWDQPVTLRAHHPAKADVLVPVTVRRGATTAVDIAMAP